MFGLFKKKENEIRTIEKIIISEEAKWKLMLENWRQNDQTVYIFWFDETHDQAATYFAANGGAACTLLTAREVQSHHLTGRTPAFAEHYPLLSKERALFEKLGLTSVVIYSSLQEPLFKLFGSDKIIQLMKQLGMKEDEVVEHKMISNSIRNAQEKIEKKVDMDLSARSQKDWIEKNLPNGKL
jgi:hypothetical protein